MIWAAIAAAIAVALGASGGKPSSVLADWLKEWRKHLRKHVDDDDRQAAAIAIVDAEAKHLDQFFVEIGAELQTLYTIHRDYHSTVEDYVPGIDAMMAALAELQYAQVDAALEMRATLTEEEWVAVQAAIGERLDDYWKHRRRADEKAKAKAAKHE